MRTEEALCDCDECSDCLHRAKEDRYQQRKADAAAICRDAKRWLEPLLVGGLSAARNGPIGPTAERLAESILIALENTIRRPGRFSASEADDEPLPY